MGRQQKQAVIAPAPKRRMPSTQSDRTCLIAHQSRLDRILQSME